ncbi:ABC transporter substrate-binding protein [Stackebrandtia nassauensis]|uniref:Extracellular solute-binding protein family 1 n=1 Tax=Stackebrandtia nassauensis (strain DSM 44728 / CIP 108903 / NRRL B-16338 / NBRC 102104 / LLR-40K-21) TaxID=446470 RepID=D3Q1S4_STANL|nr:ABC transporter substrate-binding protein [Stackebrandtia nassauensis]ADD39922.1 extracellular solute-binding protein family 1 [Stackebrandtia nassauensis DSM 44728]
MPLPDSGPFSRRALLGLAAGSTAAIALSACGGGSDTAEDGSQGGTKYDGPKVDLDFWNGFTGGDGPIMKQLVKDFNAEHDNIKVKMTTYEWESYYEKVPAAVRSGKAPDIGIMHVDSLATNAARGVILPLDDVADALKLSKGDFVEPVWNAGVYDKKRYGIPLDVHPEGNFYNKKLLDEAGLDPDNPPATGDDYADALDKLKKAKIKGMWMTPFPFTGSHTFQSLLWQFGGDLFSSDAKDPAFAEDAGVKALTWMVDLVKDGHSPKDVGQDADAVAFQNGKTAFNWNGIWSINTFNDVDGLEWGVAPLPQIGEQKAAWAGSHNFVLLKQRTVDTNKQAASKVFVNWISGKSVEWAKGGQVPARNSVRDSKEFGKLTEQSVFAEQVDYLHFPPAVPGIGDAMPQVDKAVNQAVLLKKKPADALADAADKAAKILAENRKKYG